METNNDNLFHSQSQLNRFLILLPNTGLDAEDIWDLYNDETRRIFAAWKRRSLKKKPPIPIYSIENAKPTTLPITASKDWAKKRNKKENDIIESTIQDIERVQEEQARIEREKRERELRLKIQQEEAERKRREEQERKEKEKRERELLEAREREKREREEQSKKDELRKTQSHASQREKELKERFKDDPKEDANYYWNIIETIKSDITKPVSENKDLKNFCFSQRRKITPRLGQITKSNSQIQKITSLLQGTFQEAQTKGPVVYKWILNFFCKAVVKQAEAEVSVNLSSAFPLAKLCLLLCFQNPDLFDLLLARLQKKCPWVIPEIYDLHTEIGRKKMGYKKMTDGRYEQQAPYIERQCGIFAVYAAFVSLDDSLAPRSWRLFSRLLNLTSPREFLDKDIELGQILCSIVTTYLDIAGRALLRTYGNQARKLLSASFSKLYVGEERGGSPYGRLRIVGEDWLNGKGGLDFSFEP
ncbi:RNA export factor Gle1 [Schizosaccharomyces cryophilus OY26]|uniref:mRNA export factor GLE1 n=1 Tax=Schizosaccharomyces cryophilus (strain OY26 / ATCC MYA-4695 / CBS 11777 / NBRC 106824 / NRRL Y48691) TaxID=653667 RepID=S9VTY9_SCHCR|nr:RNA export factor Gle1 [Schizosaccharomyces cryophilus OY26]EPY49560.1 RNA export factor Gle1 [Schizosaccharomyces cryophilus OY26]